MMQANTSLSIPLNILHESIEQIQIIVDEASEGNLELNVKTNPVYINFNEITYHVNTWTTTNYVRGKKHICCFHSAGFIWACVYIYS